MLGSTGNHITADTAAPPRPGRAPSGRRRRVVTVLFIDIVGFTALVDDLDPEDVWALQRDYFAVVARAVQACGGVVEKYIGDAVMAVFGARRAGQVDGDTDRVDGDADEADARDAFGAVLAGLLMQMALRDHLLAGRFPVQARVGLATGEAIVDLDAAANGGHAMISGSVVTTAARLQAYAPHGTVVVDAATRQVTDLLVAYQELPPAVVEGKAAPVELWRALHPQRRQPAPARAGRSVVLVGGAR